MAYAEPGVLFYMGPITAAARGGGNVECTGLTRTSRVNPAEMRLKIHIRALEWAQMLGQPCAFQGHGRLLLPFWKIPHTVTVGGYPIVTFEKQLLNLIGNLV